MLKRVSHFKQTQHPVRLIALWKWCLAKLVPPELPLPAKVLKFTSIAVIISSIAGIFVNTSLGLPIQLNLIISLCALGAFVLFLKMPIDSHYNRSGLVLILLGLTTNSLNWFSNGGSYASAPYYVVLLIGYAAVTLTGAYLWWTVTICIATMSALIGLEMFFPHWVAHIKPGSWQAKLDIITANILISFTIAWFVSLMTRVSRQQYERAEEASKAKSLFLSQLSHELRTPLNSVIGFSKVMLGKELPYAKEQKYIQSIHTNGSHLLALVNQILDVSMIESGKLDVIKQNVDLVQILTEIEDVVSLQASEKGLYYHTVLPEASPPEVKAYTDPNRIRQILINLISNGLKFSQQGGVTCRLTLLPDHIQVDIEDTGSGIPIEQQKQIFEPFVRLEKHHNIDGTGIGLTITQMLCQHLDCELSISRSSEQGSVFTVLIPYQKV
jgi:signal transduction histidine kinase